MARARLESQHVEALFLKTQEIHDYYGRLRARFEETGLCREEPEIYAYLEEALAACGDLRLLLHARMFKGTGYGELFQNLRPRSLRSALRLD